MEYAAYSSSLQSSTWPTPHTPRHDGVRSKPHHRNWVRGLLTIERTQSIVCTPSKGGEEERKRRSSLLIVLYLAMEYTLHSSSSISQVGRLLHHKDEEYSGWTFFLCGRVWVYTRGCCVLHREEERRHTMEYAVYSSSPPRDGGGGLLLAPIISHHMQEDEE